MPRACGDRVAEPARHAVNVAVDLKEARLPARPLPPDQDLVTPVASAWTCGLRQGTERDIEPSPSPALSVPRVPDWSLAESTAWMGRACGEDSCEFHV